MDRLKIKEVVEWESVEKKKELKSKKRFFLTNRDLRAIRWIVEQGIATLDQVWRTKTNLSLSVL
ncbi:MAG: hypothetical protein ABIQ95_04270 [Bdellovibrionia bacterium]